MYVPFYLKEWLANYRIEDYARLNSMAMCLGEMYVDKYILHDLNNIYLENFLYHEY